MKKILQNPETLVDEMCRGLVLPYSSLEYLPDCKVIKKREIDPNKVSLISGGGSGHEPAHAGFVGKGMLDAAVCGDVFASPSQIQVYKAIHATATDKGTLLIIKNYSGDIMNFQNAAYLAETDGIKVDYIKVADDIAVEDSLYTVGRRGVAGTVLVHKIAGAAAQAGNDLAQVKRIAQKAADNVRSVGFAFTSCTVPAKGSPMFTLEEDEMEYGVGIHGEPGIRREKILKAQPLAQRMVDALLADLGMAEGSAHSIGVLINGFGATPLMELYALNYVVIKILAEKGIAIFRSFVGNYMTSIDMAGASVSIIKLDDELKSFLAMPCDAPAFVVNENQGEVSLESICEKKEQDDSAVSLTADASGTKAVVANNVLSKENIIYLIDKMAEIIIQNEVAFCELDAHAGDGDFGMSIAKGFKQLKVEWIYLLENSNSIGAFLNACSIVIMEHCGGASGPIWGFAFKFAAKAAGDVQQLDINKMAEVLQGAVTGIQTVGERSFGRGAVVGDKTLIDALLPCADEWGAIAKRGGNMQSAFEGGAKAAVAGAETTKGIVARMGRAGTVGERSIGHPDAGAHALGIIFTKLAEGLRF